MTRGAVDAGDDAGVEFGGLGGELRDTLLHGGAEFTGQVRWRRAGGQESVLCHLFAEERAVELFFAFEEQAGEAVTGDEDVARDFAEGHNIGGWFESEFPPGNSSTAAAVSARTAFQESRTCSSLTIPPLYLARGNAPLG